jgi:hypothetical protein
MKLITHSLFVLCFCVLTNTTTAYCLSAGDDDSLANRPSRPKRVYSATRLSTEKPTIDGNLNDACWKTGNWAGEFIQWIPTEGGKASHPTQLKIFYDDQHMYVAIRAFDSEPDKISRKAGRRDELTGDAVGITFDSYHDHRTGFEFDVTAAGQKVDLILTNPANPDMNWNAVWNVKTGMEDSAWTAEFEIPLSQLRYSSDVEQVWGMHCWRWIDRLQEESDWEPQSSQGPGMLYLFGELRGIKELPPSRRIEIMPYTLGTLKTFKREPGNPYADKGRSWLGNAGVDAKIGLSSNFTADFSINPDFGQVEADPSVMNLSAFETFYDEKRPFFLEGKNIFSFDVDDANLFYSRRIGSTSPYTPVVGANEFMDFPGNPAILSAVKLSGKTADGFSVGVMQSLTANEQRETQSPTATRNVSVAPLTNYIVARAQQDYTQGNSVIGGIVTATNRFIHDPQLEFMNRNAFTGGLDLLHQWSEKEFYVEAKVIGSTIDGSREAIRLLQTSSARYYQSPDAYEDTFDSTRTRLTGFGGRVKVGKGSVGSWRYSTELNWRSPGLDLNDLGFMQTADVVKQRNNLSYAINQPESIFRTYSFGVNQFNNWDFGMRHVSSGGGANLYLEFLNRWAFSTSMSYTSQALDTRILRGGDAMLLPASWTTSFYARTDAAEKLYADVSTNFNWSEDGSAHSTFVQPGISVMPMNTLKLSMSVNYSDNTDNLQYIDTKTLNNGNRFLLGKLHQQTLGVTFRIDYNITPEVSIQYYGSPFASVGSYADFKTVTNPRAGQYGDRFALVHTALNGTDYAASEHEGAPTAFTFGDPDFSFSQFHSNLVFRWEYLPGSQLYLVWSNEMTSYLNPRRSSINDALANLNDVFPNSIFLIKFNYWFTM